MVVHNKTFYFGVIRRFSTTRSFHGDTLVKHCLQKFRRLNERSSFARILCTFFPCFDFIHMIQSILEIGEYFDSAGHAQSQEEDIRDTSKTEGNSLMLEVL